MLALVEEMVEVSETSFIHDWTYIISLEFSLDLTTLRSLYDYSTDMYDTESNTRAMWKYNTARKVSGTPTAFINGAKIATMPDSAQAWIDLLQSVYDSQYHAATQLQ